MRAGIVIVRWVAVVAWAGVIVFLSSNTATGLNSDLGVFSDLMSFLRSIEESIFGQGVDILSPIGHAFEYMILSFLLVNALWQHMPLTRACVVAVICCSIFGASDEIHQYFVPERQCDPLDWLVDTAAAAFGAFAGRPVLMKIDKAGGADEDQSK